MARRPPRYRRYKLYFYEGKISPRTKVPHKRDKKGKIVWYDVVDALDYIDARRTGEARHPDLICIPFPYPRQEN